MTKMTVGSAIAVYFVIWWTVLFVVLPLRVSSLHEAGETPSGHEPGAPARPLLLWKAAVTSLIALVVFAVVYGLVDVFD